METKWTALADSFKSANVGFEMSEKDGKVNLKSCGDKYSCITLTSDLRKCKPNKKYKIKIDEQSENIDVRLLVNWYDSEGNKKYRCYINKECEIVTEDDIVALNITANLCTLKKGEASIGRIEIEESGDYEPHLVRIATLDSDYTLSYTLNSTKEIMDVYEREIDKIYKKEKPDLIVLGEHFHSLTGGVIPESEKYIEMDSWVINIIKNKAKEYGVFISGSFHVKDEEGKHNRAILFDRKGNIIGQYDKTHLTASEHQMGLVPGKEIPVFDTEIGRIGFMICWDLWFPEFAQALYLKNCDIIINPTRGVGRPQCYALSYTTGCYLATAGSDFTMTRIQDKSGNTLSDATNGRGYACATIDINKPEWHYNLSVVGSYGEGRNIYKNERRPELYDILTKHPNMMYVK